MNSLFENFPYILAGAVTVLFVTFCIHYNNNPEAYQDLMEGYRSFIRDFVVRLSEDLQLDLLTYDNLVQARDLLAIFVNLNADLCLNFVYVCGILAIGADPSAPIVPGIVELGIDNQILQELLHQIELLIGTRLGVPTIK